MQRMAGDCTGSVLVDVLNAFVVYLSLWVTSPAYRSPNFTTVGMSYKGHRYKGH